jgi:hypothetical protein
MPKNKYDTETFNQLRLITSYLGLGNDKLLKKLCETIEEFTRHSSPHLKIKLAAYKTGFEDAIFPKNANLV